MAVVGLGGVGLASILALSRRARSVVAVIFPRACARGTSVRRTFNAADADLVEKVKQATRRRRLCDRDGGLDARLRTAYRVTRRGGTTVTAGHASARRDVGDASTNLVAEERTIKGSYIGTCALARPAALHRAYQQGSFP